MLHMFDLRYITYRDSKFADLWIAAKHGINGLTKATAEEYTWNWWLSYDDYWDCHWRVVARWVRSKRWWRIHRGTECLTSRGRKRRLAFLLLSVRLLPKSIDSTRNKFGLTIVNNLFIFSLWFAHFPMLKPNGFTRLENHAVIRPPFKQEPRCGLHNWILLHA